MIKDRSSEFRRKASEFLTNDPSISIDVESNISCTQNDSFFAEIDEIRNLMTKLSDDVSNVKMQLRSILARTIVDGNEKEKLDECMAGIKYRSSLLRKHLLTMKQNVKGSGSDNVIIGGINERIRQYHIEALIKKLSDLLEMFNAAQLDYRTQVSKRIKRQLDVAGEHMTDDEVNAMIDSNSMEIFNRRMRSSELKSVLNDASLRHNEIKNLEASIKELNDLYNDMAFLMQTQGDTVDRIDRCTSNAFNYVIAGNQQAQSSIFKLVQ
uniref:t-SNARE coiled-coil homology domain-containing protein n=1 Tax=Setaria digitata TaxID=48799 RepID=A0A915Q2Z9_9BILA